LSEIDNIIGDKDYPEVKVECLNNGDKKIYNEIKSLSQKFEKAMDEDFNTAIGIGHIYRTVRALNRYLSRQKFTREDHTLAVLGEAKKVFSRIGKVLGLFQIKPAEYLEMVKNKRLARLDITAEEIERLVEERNQARKEKNWARADQIRETLLKKNILLEDKRDKTIWKVL
ncbi:MAG: cysteine--tRNA ligase, partial [Deltaproteobacteria bacterium]